MKRSAKLAGPMKIPRTFRLLGTEYTVRLIPRDEWDQDAECVGLFKPQACEIHIQERSREAMEHTYLHELLHACILATGRDKLYKDEAFIDMLAGLLHQALTTAR